MTSTQDLRAKIASLEKMVHQLRNTRGADRDVKTRRKVRTDLKEDVADAAYYELQE